MTKRLRHHVLFAATLACTAAACSDRPSPVAPRTTVLAQRNAGAPTPVDPTQFVDPIATEICGFPVQVALSGKAKTLLLPGDRLIVTAPGLTATLTNLTSRHTEHLVITGTVQFADLPNGNVEIVQRGRNIVGMDDSFLLIIGHFSFVVDPATGATVEPLHGNGQVVDICELLS
jgi:hypothetical protein